MLSLTDFIAYLPGVKPKLARTAILEGDVLSKEERRSIIYRNAYLIDDVLLVGPDAAAAIGGIPRQIAHEQGGGCRLGPAGNRVRQRRGRKGAVPGAAA